MELNEMTLQDVEARLSAIDGEIEGATELEAVNALAEEKRNLIERQKTLKDLAERKATAKMLQSGVVAGKIHEEGTTKMEEKRTFAVDSAEYREAFLKALMGKDLTAEERGAMDSGDASGGAAIPTITLDKIIQKLGKASPILDEIDLMQIEGNVTIVPPSYIMQAGLYAQLSNLDTIVFAVGFLQDDDYDRPAFWVPTPENTVLIKMDKPDMTKPMADAEQWYHDYIEAGETPAWTDADAELVKWLKSYKPDNKKRRCFSRGWGNPPSSSLGGDVPVPAPVRAVRDGHHGEKTQHQREDYELIVGDHADCACECGGSRRGMDGAGGHHDEDGARHADSAADPVEVLQHPGHVEEDGDGDGEYGGEYVAEEHVLGPREGGLGRRVDEDRGGTEGSHDELAAAAVDVHALVDESEHCNSDEGEYGGDEDYRHRVLLRGSERVLHVIVFCGYNPAV